MSPTTAWSEVSIGSIAELVRGVSYKKERSASTPGNGLMPLLRATNITSPTLLLESDLVYIPAAIVADKQILQVGDIVIAASSGSPAVVGKSAMLTTPWHGTFGAFCTVLRPFAVEPRFLAYRILASDIRTKWSMAAAGTNINNLKRDDILETRLRLPDASEQSRIVSTIESLVSRIDAAKGSLQAASTKVNFLHLRFVEERVIRSEVRPLGDVLSALNYGTSTKCSNDGAGSAVLRIPNVKDGRIDLTDLKYAEDPAIDLSSCLTKPSDLLFIRTNGSKSLIGRAAAVGSNVGVAFASYLIRATVNIEKADPSYLTLALSLPQSRRQIEAKAASTAGQYNLNLASIKSLRIPLPDLTEQREIVRLVEDLGARTAIVGGAVDRVLLGSEKLRRAIFEQAFAGALTAFSTGSEPNGVSRL